MDRSLIRPSVLPIVVTAAAVACAACQRPAEPKSAPPSASAAALVEPAGPPAPEVQAAVQGVLDAARHPWLRWPTVSHGLPALRRLYAPEAEPDGLFWFAGDKPYPDLAAAVETIGKAKEEGLDPEDYDAARLASEWKRISAPGASPTDRGVRASSAVSRAGDAGRARRFRSPPGTSFPVPAPSS